MKNNKSYIVIALFIVLGIIVLTNYQKIYKLVLPPSPVIVSSNADESSTTIFEYSIMIKGEVSNKGGDGYIVIEASVYQGSETWTKTEQLYLQASQTSSFIIVFDEVKLLEEVPKYRVRTFALGHKN